MFSLLFFPFFFPFISSDCELHCDAAAVVDAVAASGSLCSLLLPHLVPSHRAHHLARAQHTRIRADPATLPTALLSRDQPTDCVTVRDATVW